MSVKFLSDVFNLSLGSSSLKAVAIALADRADDKTGMCFPSIEDTVQRTELNKKTVENNMGLLKREKILIDTGRRVGKTNQIPVYYFDVERLKQFCSALEHPQKRNTPKFGTVPIFPESPPKTGGVTPPKTGYGTPNGTIKGTPTPEVRQILFDEIEWPPQLAPEDRKQIINRIPEKKENGARLQCALDEFIAAGHGQVIRNPSAWVLACWKSSITTPAGRAIAKAREKKQQHQVAPAQQPSSNTSRKNTAEAALNLIKKNLGMPDVKFDSIKIRNS